MTIDEAIKDLEYGTKQLEMEIKSGLWIKGSESDIREDKVVPVVMFCPDCGQKIDWGMGSSKNG